MDGESDHGCLSFLKLLDINLGVVSSFLGSIVNSIFL